MDLRSAQQELASKQSYTIKHGVKLHFQPKKIHKLLAFVNNFIVHCGFALRFQQQTVAMPVISLAAQKAMIIPLESTTTSTDAIKQTHNQ